MRKRGSQTKPTAKAVDLMVNKVLSETEAVNLGIEDCIRARAARYIEVANRGGMSVKSLTLGGEDNELPFNAPEIDSDNQQTTIRISGPIDRWFGCDVRSLIETLDETNPSEINLLIESPGGLLWDGLALYADLRARVRDGATVRTEARGLVASAASVIYLAGDERTAVEGSSLMVHDPWVFLMMLDNADGLEANIGKYTRMLRNGEKTLRAIVEARTPANAAQADKWLRDETWFTVDEAIEAGLVDSEVEDEPRSDPTNKVTDDQANEIARRIMTIHTQSKRGN